MPESCQAFRNGSLRYIESKSQQGGRCCPFFIRILTVDTDWTGLMWPSRLDSCLEKVQKPLSGGNFLWPAFLSFVTQKRKIAKEKRLFIQNTHKVCGKLENCLCNCKAFVFHFPGCVCLSYAFKIYFDRSFLRLKNSLFYLSLVYPKTVLILVVYFLWA